MNTKRSLFLVLFLVLVISSVYLYHWYALKTFKTAFSEYQSVALRHDEAATIPMLPENPLRRDLNQILADVLTGNLSEAERVARAREGLALLVLAEGHIDAVGELAEDVTETILLLEHTANIASLSAWDEERALIEMAHRRLSIISDIRGLSYRANHDMKTIFQRIVADNGVLTSEHQRALDLRLPEIEEQFNRRTNLHAELESFRNEMRRVFARVESTW